LIRIDGSPNGSIETPTLSIDGIEARKALPNELGAVTHTGTATWRSGYAAVCKSDCFAFEINAYSEKQAKLSACDINRLHPEFGIDFG
jgi:hypothetical protein